MRNVCVKPGYNCATLPCQHKVKGEHGVASDQWWYSVRNESGTVALVLRVISGKYPPTVTWIHDRTPVAAYLHLHEHRALPYAKIDDESTDSDGSHVRETCEFLAQGPCASREIISSASVSDAFDSLVVNDIEQSEAFWLALENMLVEYEALGSVSHTVLLLDRVAKLRSTASGRRAPEPN